MALSPPVLAKSFLRKVHVSVSVWETRHRLQIYTLISAFDRFHQNCVNSFDLKALTVMDIHLYVKVLFCSLSAGLMLL